MKPDSEINEAALVAGFSSFSKELAGLSFENVNSGAFVAAVGRLVDRIYPDVVSVLYYRLESGGKLTCTFPLSDAPCSPEDFEAHIGGSKKLEIEYHNQGCFVDKKYSAYAVVSFFLKKELFFSVVLCGKKRELRDVAQTLPAFQSYVASEFRRLRSVHKEIKSARRSEQATLLSTTRYLLRNRGGKRWFSEYTDSGTPLGTDFTGLYPCGSDGWLS